MILCGTHVKPIGSLARKSPAFRRDASQNEPIRLGPPGRNLHHYAVPRFTLLTMESSPPQGSSPAAVVGIGASAGGLNTYTELLGALPPNTGMTFVIGNISPLIMRAFWRPYSPASRKCR